MTMQMEIASARDPDQVRAIHTHPSRSDRRAAGVAGIFPVNVGRPVDAAMVPTNRVNQTPEGLAADAKAVSPMRAIGLASGCNRRK